LLYQTPLPRFSRGRHITALSQPILTFTFSMRPEIFEYTRRLRYVEFNRLTVILKASTILGTTYLDDEEANVITNGQLLSHLIGVVSVIS
jgi:hypothetical protein